MTVACQQVKLPFNQRSQSHSLPCKPTHTDTHRHTPRFKTVIIGSTTLGCNAFFSFKTNSFYIEINRWRKEVCRCMYATVQKCWLHIVVSVHIHTKQNSNAYRLYFFFSHERIEQFLMEINTEHFAMLMYSMGSTLTYCTGGILWLCGKRQHFLIICSNHRKTLSKTDKVETNPTSRVKRYKNPQDHKVRGVVCLWWRGRRHLWPQK